MIYLGLLYWLVGIFVWIMLGIIYKGRFELGEVFFLVCIGWIFWPIFLVGIIIWWLIPEKYKE